MDMIYRCTNPDYILNRGAALEYSMEEQDKLAGVDVPEVLNEIPKLTDLFKDDLLTQNLNPILDAVYNSKAKVGICSLSETNKSQPMWAMYSDNYKGYCVEYDFEHAIEAAIDCYPVIYASKRMNNIILALVDMIMNSAIERMSNGRIKGDQSQVLKIFLTKSRDWAFQKEWRIIGDAGYHFPAPKITKVFVGSKSTKENFDKVLKLGKEKDFSTYITEANTGDLKLHFRKIS